MKALAETASNEGRTNLRKVNIVDAKLLTIYVVNYSISFAVFANLFICLFVCLQDRYIVLESP